MELTLTMTMDNAAFEDFPGTEAARILREVAKKIENGYTDGRMMDINGNKVGEWEINED